MASSEVSARLRYLSNAAHLLAITSPAVSRHLMTKHNDLLLDNDTDVPESQRRKACGACGTIMISGWEGKFEINPRQGGRKKQRSITSTETPTPNIMVYTCNSCGCKTRFSVLLDSKAPRYKPKTSRLDSSKIVKPAATDAKPIEPPATAPNESSKKRARPKKQSGLSAILAKQKAAQTASSGFGLDLMDFMKKS